MEEYRTPEWSCAEVLQLIKEYGNRPELWDPDCEDYKNRFKKHHKWMELAAIFKCSKLEVERKMKILNSQYRRERLKAARMRKLGKTHRVTWYGYRAFGFMNNHWIKSVRCKNGSNLMSDSGIKQEVPEESDAFVGCNSDLIPFFAEANPQDENIPDVNLEDTGTSTVSEKELENHQARDGVNVQIKDEWALFGEMVAHAFRKFPDDRTRCIVKHKINTVLYEAELATYDKPK